MMGDKQKEDEHIAEVLRDWKLLAQKADYFLFWVFFTITTVTRSVSRLPHLQLTLTGLGKILLKSKRYMYSIFH